VLWGVSEEGKEREPKSGSTGSGILKQKRKLKGKGEPNARA